MHAVNYFGRTPIPAQNLKGKRKTQPLSREINESMQIMSM